MEKIGGNLTKLHVNDLSHLVANYFFLIFHFFNAKMLNFIKVCAFSNIHMCIILEISFAYILMFNFYLSNESLETVQYVTLRIDVAIFSLLVNYSFVLLRMKRQFSKTAMCVKCIVFLLLLFLY